MNATASFVRLYLEETRGLSRGRFALAGTALCAGLLCVLAVVVALSPLGLWSFALLVYGVGPVLAGTFAAMQTAGLRASRFIHPLYTTPVRASHVLAAQVLVALTVSAGYLLATAPFFGVAALHVDVPASVLRLGLGGGALMTFAVALGTLFGVLLPGRSIAAPVSLTAGFLVLSMLAIPPAAMLQAEGAVAGAAIMHALHVSPYVLVSDGLGLLEPSVGMEAREPMRALLLVSLQTLALFALAAWTYLREQGPEGWETTPPRRVALTALTALLLFAVPLAAGTAYAPLDDHAPQGRGWSSHDQGASVALVATDSLASGARFEEHLAGTQADPLHASRPNARDLLILLPLAEGETFSQARVTLEGDPRLVIDPATFTFDQEMESERLHSDGGRSGVVLRIPTTLTPLDPQDLTSNWHQLWVNVTYHVDAEEAPREGEALAALRADVPWALAQMGGAGIPLLLLTTVAAVSRHARVGRTR